MIDGTRDSTHVSFPAVTAGLPPTACILLTWWSEDDDNDHDEYIDSNDDNDGDDGDDHEYIDSDDDDNVIEILITIHNNHKSNK